MQTATSAPYAYRKLGRTLNRLSNSQRRALVTLLRLGLWLQSQSWLPRRFGQAVFGAGCELVKVMGA